jgi:hypothetical protein
MFAFKMYVVDQAARAKNTTKYIAEIEEKTSTWFRRFDPVGTYTSSVRRVNKPVLGKRGNGAEYTRKSLQKYVSLLVLLQSII